MQGMVSMMLIIIALFVSTSPLKLSFLVMVLSIWVAMMSLMTTSNLFPTSGMIISFSTGMMILFCYCASMIMFEKKNLKSNKSIYLVVLLLLMINTEKMAEMTNSPTTMMKYQTQFLVVAIMLVLLSMLGVNKSMFNPSKSNMSTY